MKVAYLILAHKNISQLALLINSLNHSSATFFLHVDAQCAFSEEDFRLQLKRSDNLNMLEPRNINSWGGFSLVDTTIKLLELCQGTDTYNYVSLISGMDFPLMPVKEMLDFLEKNEGAEFVEHFALPDETKWNGYFGSYRYEKFWMIDQIGFEDSKSFVNQQIYEQIQRTMPSNLKPYGGSQWFTITFNCLQYILCYIKHNKEIVLFFQHCLVPDEMIFNTIIMNSHFKEQVVNNNLRYIDWKSGPQYPRIFTIWDFKNLINSQCHFGRKFDFEIDKAILYKIENYII